VNVPLNESGATRMVSRTPGIERTRAVCPPARVDGAQMQPPPSPPRYFEPVQRALADITEQPPRRSIAAIDSGVTCPYTFELVNTATSWRPTRRAPPHAHQKASQEVAEPSSPTTTGPYDSRPATVPGPDSGDVCASLRCSSPAIGRQAAVGQVGARASRLVAGTRLSRVPVARIISPASAQHRSRESHTGTARLFPLSNAGSGRRQEFLQVPRQNARLGTPTGPCTRG
jgi:hypothetical protein